MINHFVIQGRFTRDPELKVTTGGVSVCSFRIAWSSKQGETERTLFLNCVAWRKMGEFISNYFQKGQVILLEGDLMTRTWQGRDGQEKSDVELTVARAHFCGGKKQDSAPSHDRQAAGWAPYMGEDDPFAGEDLPY
jgi:single-strand DNA-binding protein